MLALRLFRGRDEARHVRRLLALLKRPVVAVVEAIQGLASYRAAAARFRPDVRIAEATGADLQAVHAWFTQSREVSPAPRNPGVTNFVAKHGTKIVGFVQLVRRGDDAGSHAGYWLYSLRVRLPYRGMGLGEALCQKVIDLAQAEHAPELSLMVNTDNNAAIPLYCKLGFAGKKVPELEPQTRQPGMKSRHVMSIHLTPE